MKEKAANKKDANSSQVMTVDQACGRRVKRLTLWPLADRKGIKTCAEFPPINYKVGETLRLCLV